MSDIPPGAGTTTGPLAQFADAQAEGAGAEVLRAYTTVNQQTELMWTATGMIEDRCGRRLAPFTSITESQRAQGVDGDILGAADMPMDLQAALGYSQAIAFASTNLVRDIWLDQYAPVRPDLWTYTLTSIQLLLAFGDNLTVGSDHVQGPEPDSGHLRLNLGTFCPVGTWVRVTYGGGYQQIPYGLRMACIYQAFKIALVSAEPEARKEMSTAELDAEILSLLAPYIRT